MESLKVGDSCKKNVIVPYQQSFRIDDLLTPKAIEQQPGHFCSPPHPTTLQAPPLGPGGHRMEQPSAMDMRTMGNGACQVNGKVV